MSVTDEIVSALREHDAKYDIKHPEKTAGSRVSEISSNRSLKSNESTEVGKDGDIDPETGETLAHTSLETDLQLITRTLDAFDDPTISPYSFRSFFLGLGLSAFGSVIAEIFYFKPQTVLVNTIFLQIIAYVLGEIMTIIPRWGPVGRFLNPGPFTMKEHIFITIMASAASVSALGTAQLAAQDLYYNQKPNAASAIFLLLSSQLLGYGFLAVMRKAFVYPTKMLWPLKLPNAALFQTLHLDKALAKRRLKIFWIVFFFICIWEIVPQYLFPLTIGISVFCLANQNSAPFTFLFGGANANEGLGFLSWSMDWQFVGTDQFLLPIDTLFNQFIGYILGICMIMGLYWTEVWNAKNFPFMAQAMIREDGLGLYDQTAILTGNNVVDPALVAENGLPWFSTSAAAAVLTFNIGVSATIVHILLWNWSDVKGIFTWAHPRALRQYVVDAKKDGRYKFWKTSTSVETFPGTEGDPHFAAMRAYKEAPSWWYVSVLLFGMIAGLIVTYKQDTGLPWWAFFLSCLISFLLLCIYAPFFAITGFYTPPTTAIQIIGAYMVPRRPVANMMFTLYGSDSMVQGLLMLGDLKLAQYAKLPPRATFIAQMLGTIVGAILNWVMMDSIIKNQREILLNPYGSTVWSGQNVQAFNSQAIAWGGLAQELFARGATYFMLPMGLAIGVVVPLPFWIGHKFFPRLRLDRVNTPIITTWMGWLAVGINSSLLPYFVFGLFTQYYLRKYRSVLYARYNLIVTAAIGGGVQIIVFILTFAVFGGAGKERPFPQWWGNYLDGNVDRCLSARYSD